MRLCIYLFLFSFQAIYARKKLNKYREQIQKKGFNFEHLYLDKKKSNSNSSQDRVSDSVLKNALSIQ